MEYGYLKVNVSTAGGALPVEGADVTVTDSGSPVKILYSVKTDSSGTTPPLKLEAPPKNLSEISGNRNVYAVYGVITDKAGYRRVADLSVPVFSGITSIQPVELIPLPFGTRDARTEMNKEGDGYDL